MTIISHANDNLRFMSHGPTTPRPHDLKRSDLPRLNLTPLHVARNWTKADVFLGEWPPDSGRRVVVKDIKPRALWFRLIGGRYAMKREWQALEALQGLKGVPAPIALIDPDCFVMELREGTPIKNLHRGDVKPETLQQLQSLLSEMHRRGVTHGDLHGGNILVDDQGGVSLIDWVTASFFGPSPKGPKAVSFANWRALDERALLKVKLSHAPDHITPHEREILLNGPSPLYRFVKNLRFLMQKMRGKNPSREWMYVSAEMRRMLEKSSQDSEFSSEQQAAPKKTIES
jgi:aminoglycoside phosphotransferase (APT) family kinase protein